MSEQDLTPDQLEQLREQLASVSAADVVAEAALSLIALATTSASGSRRPSTSGSATGRSPAAGGHARRDAGGDRGPPRRRRGQPARGLANLHLAYAGVAADSEGAAARRPSPEADDSGILSPAESGLWVPGAGLTRRPRPGGAPAGCCVMPDVRPPNEPRPVLLLLVTQAAAFEACRPLGPSVISNSTAWPSLRSC